MLIVLFSPFSIFFQLPLGFPFFFLISSLFLFLICPPDQASLVLRDVDRISKPWGFSSIDEFGHLIEIGLLDPVDGWVDIEGSRVVEVACRIVIIVQGPAGCM